MQLFCQSVNRNHAEPHRISHSLAQTASEPANRSTYQAVRHQANQVRTVRLPLAELLSHSGFSQKYKIISTILVKSQILPVESVSVSGSQSTPALAQASEKTSCMQSAHHKHNVTLSTGLSEIYHTHILGSSLKCTALCRATCCDPTFTAGSAGNDSVQPLPRAVSIPPCFYLLEYFPNILEVVILFLGLLPRSTASEPFS